MQTAIKPQAVGDLPLVGPDPHTPEWYAMRLYDPERKIGDLAAPVIFGASECAAVCGMSPYETPLHVYLRKRREIDPIEDNDAMRLGRKLEPVVIDEYRERTGYAVLAPRPTFIHYRHRFLSATPDGMVMPTTNSQQAVRAEDVFPLDAKTTTWRRAKDFGEEGSDELPEDYLLQAQQQMLVMGAALQDTAVLVDGRTLKVYRVQRNDDLAQIIVDAARELAERIVNGDPPEPNWTHAQTPELVRAMWGVDETKAIVLDEPIGLMWRNYRALGEEIKEREKEQQQIKARVLAAMQDAAIGRYPQDGFELVRKRVERGAYTVEATSFITLRERKIK